MFLYVTLGTNDLARAQKFYDAVMPPLGFGLRRVEDTEIGYGPPAPERIRLWITLPFDGLPATIGNGSMPAFLAPSRKAVDAFYEAALAHGGTDEGAPGLRYRPDFYACFVRDPDGNKMGAVREGPE